MPYVLFYLIHVTMLAAIVSLFLPCSFFLSCQAVAVEKPVAGSVEDILECHAVCQANDVPLYCSFQRLVLFLAGAFG